MMFMDAGRSNGGKLLMFLHSGRGGVGAAGFTRFRWAQ
jgi:hypothetical protein